MLSYDMTFMVLVRMALEGIRPTLVPGRCVAHPFRRHAMAKPEKGSAEARVFALCSAATVLLSYHKLKDDISDSKGFRRFGSRLLLPTASGIRKRAKLGDVTEATIAARLSELAALEADECDSLDRAAAPFGELMAYLCAWGFDEGSSEARIASEIGRHIGRFIYIIDAIDDLADDVKSGSYNPFAKMYGDPLEVFEPERLRTALTMELMGVEAAVELIGFDEVPEYGEIIRNIIYLGLPEVINKTLSKNSATAENGEQKDE